MYLPTAATGNSRSLATFGPSGELMGFFYPSIDFAQNVREGMFALWAGPGGGGAGLEWCFSGDWMRQQYFKPRSNVLVTELKHAHQHCEVRVTDFLPPGEDALIRHFEITRADPGIRGVLYQYFNLSIDDVDRRNAVHLLPEERVIVQQFRETVLAVGSSSPFGVQCGTVVPRGESNVKKGMAAGSIHGGDQCLGDVDFAVGFELEAMETCQVTVVLAGGLSRAEAIERARRLSSVAYGDLEAGAHGRSKATLDTAGRCPVAAYEAPYGRAVLSLMDLYDERAGTFIAAPEFDPYYSLSGGYGYCWPRDAAVSAMVAAELGFTEAIGRFFDWCAKTQQIDGHWTQRYWTGGFEAPSWCVRENEIQLDQTCAVLHAAGLHARSLGDDRDRFVARIRPMAKRAAQAIIRHIDDSGLHRQAADLWENTYGSFAYTNGAVIASLREGREVFGLEVPDLNRLREVLVERFYQPQTGRWIRTVHPDGSIDATGDSSVLGLIEPWEVFDLEDPDERSLALSTIEFVENHLAIDVAGGRAILRFQGESYMGGGPGCVNTLWLAQCKLKVAEYLDDGGRAKQIADARRLMETALAHANPVGQLPELIPFIDGLPYWAAPHGWASSLLIQCVGLLGRLEQGAAASPVSAGGASQ